MDTIESLRDENTRLRAALANSKSPCVYCSLPAEEWAKCQHGFPGCDRADDAMGCPELGAALELKALRAERDAEWQPIGTAPKDGTQIFGCWDAPTPEYKARGVVHWERIGNGYWASAPDWEKRVTHWRPLHAPPGDRTGETK